MAIFLDNLIVGIVETVRRERYLKKVSQWKIANGKILTFRTVDGEMYGLRPVIDYEYEVGGIRHQGSATGDSIHDGMMQLGDRVDALIESKPEAYIRYDPENPSRNCFLNDDNPGFLFAIDHDLLRRPRKE